MRPKSSFPILATLVAPALLTLTGCNGAQLGGLSQVMGGGLGGLGGAAGGGGLGGLGALAGGSGGFQPPPLQQLGGGSPASPTGGGVPSLNTPGQVGQSPVASLPVPQQSAGQAAQIMAAYKVRVTGAGASPQALERVAFCLRHFGTQNLQGLQSINISAGRMGSTAGMWTGGGGVGSIQYMGPPTVHTGLHEMAHHATLAQGLQGQAIQGLGQGAQGHVSQYSYNTPEDKTAEAIAYELNPQGFEQPALPTYRSPPAFVAFVKQSIVATRSI